MAARPQRKRAAAASVLDSVETEDTLGMLLAMRRVVAQKIDDPNTRAADIASLTKRLREINDEIAQEREKRAEAAPGSVAAAVATPDEELDPTSI